MKILFFVDLHDDHESFLELKEKAKDVDLIVGAGDYSIFGNYLREILKEINNFNKPTYLIRGNHEFEEEMKEAIKGLKNLKYFHKEVKEINNIKFIFYGGDGFSKKDKEFEVFTKKIAKTNKTTILVLHGPPNRTELDINYFGHTGNESYTEFIKSYQPSLVICGHIHENSEKQDLINKTTIINPGPRGLILNV
ncbi:MAG: metallophosphoesterase family protein [Candidatus Woesearchaeota archaeon]